MKIFYKWIVPPFLKKMDAFLIRNYPLVWRTQIHFVLFYGLIISFLLFSFGFLFPVSLHDNLSVHPISPIVIHREAIHFMFLGFSILGFLYWGFTQYQLKKEQSSFRGVFWHLLLYAIGLFLIFGLDTTSFRLGTIFRTALFFNG